MTDNPYEPEKQPRHPVIRPQRTHCQRGHDLRLPNAVYTSPRGEGSHCRACRTLARQQAAAVRQSFHLKRATQNPVAIVPPPSYTPPSMKSWPLTSCNELPWALTPYMARNP